MRRSSTHRCDLTRTEPGSDSGAVAGADPDSSAAAFAFAFTEGVAEGLTQAIAVATADIGRAGSDHQMLWRTGNHHGGRRALFPL